MRKALIIGLPVLALAAGGAGWMFLRPHIDPIVAAKQRMAHDDMKGAGLYLRQAVRQHPADPEAAFLLGEVDLSLSNPAAAQLEFLRARAHGYDPAAIVLPLGQAYLQQRHFDAALRDFDPDHAPPGAKAAVLTIRASAQMALHDVDGAAATAAQAEALAPDSTEALLAAGHIALSRGDLAAAGARAAHILAGHPKQADALLLQAEIDLRHNDAKAALANAETVLAATPARLDAKLMQARALAATGQEAAARKAAETVLRSMPRDVPANFLRAMLAIHAGDYVAADASLQQISSAVADLPRGNYFLAVTKLGLGQIAQAEEADTQFLTHNPTDISGLKLLAFINLAAQRPDKALALLHDSALAGHSDADTLDLQGRAQAMSGDLKGAAASFTKATALVPADIQILNRLAATELNLGNSSAGEADLKHSLDLAPNQRLAGEAIVQAALARGDIATATESVARLKKALGNIEDIGVLSAQVKIAALDMNGAEAELNDVLKRFPDSRPAALNLARIYALKGDNARAEALLETVLKKHPGDASVLDLLLPALFADHQTDRAVAVAEAAHDAAADNPQITAALAGVYVREKQPGRAVALLDRTSAGTNPMLDVLRARVLVEQGKTDRAQKAYQSVLDEAPGDPRLRGEFAAFLVHLKNFDAARATLQDGLKQLPGNALLLADLVGVDFKQSGVKAALASAAALRAVPANLPAANLLPGEVWLTAGDVRQAAIAFGAAYKTAPTSELAMKTASALARSGDTAHAIALLEGWTASHPQDMAAQSVLSSLYLDAGQLDNAAQRLTDVLATRNTDTAALNNLAWIRQRQGDKAAALALAERAYYQSPQPEVADTLGWILAKQGDTTQALPLLQQAIASRDPVSHASSAYHYGYVLAAVGRQAEARTQVQAAVDAKVAFPERADAAKFLGTLN